MTLFLCPDQQGIEIALRCDASTAHKIAEAMIRTIETDFPQVEARLTARVQMDANAPESAEP